MWSGVAWKAVDCLKRALLIDRDNDLAQSVYFHVQVDTPSSRRRKEQVGSATSCWSLERMYDVMSDWTFTLH